MRRAWVVVAALGGLAGCPRHEHQHEHGQHPEHEAPIVPAGLPPLRAVEAISGELVARGEQLFGDATLATDGKTTCATCHDPAHGFSGPAPQKTSTGEPNLRRAPALVNLAWRRAVGWDGRYPSLGDLLHAHAKGQLGQDAPATTLDALAAYVGTRYAGDAPWDRVEKLRDAPAELRAGYALFTGKAQCATCHPPPLYTDLGYHRLGLIAAHDDGRGKVDPAQQGAFATPTLRDAAARPAFFHDGSAPTLDAAIDWHLAGGTGQGADATIIDPALRPVQLAPAERAQLGAFVKALTSAR